MAYNNYYGNQGNNRGPRKSNQEDINTDGILITNTKAGKFLKTKFWEKCMGVEIGMVPPGDGFNYKAVREAQTFGHVFSFATLFELNEICEEVLDSIKTSNQFESTATEAGMKKDVIVEISNGSNINMPTGIYLVIYKSVDPGRRSGTYEFFPFGGTSVLRNYDHVTGAHKEDLRAIGEFKKFAMVVKEAAKAFTMASAHTVRSATKRDKISAFKALASMSAALGVDIGRSIDSSVDRFSGNSSYSNNQEPNSFQRTYPQYSQNQSAYQSTQRAMNMVNDEPVDINIDVANLQSVELTSFS